MRARCQQGCFLLKVTKEISVSGNYPCLVDGYLLPASSLCIFLCPNFLSLREHWIRAYPMMSFKLIYFFKDSVSQVQSHSVLRFRTSVCEFGGRHSTAHKTWVLLSPSNLLSQNKNDMLKGQVWNDLKNFKLSLQWKKYFYLMIRIVVPRRTLAMKPCS